MTEVSRFEEGIGGTILEESDKWRDGDFGAFCFEEFDEVIVGKWHKFDENSSS